MILGRVDVAIGGAVVTWLVVLEPEHAVSAMVRIRYIQEGFANI